MPIPQIYYLNGTNLSNSTAVFVDTLMTICAPDGFYSDGTIIREQVGCVLAPEFDCVSCGLSCSETEAGLVAGDDGIYNLNVNVGTSVGAIIVTFTTDSVPDGIMATYNGVAYNTLSSPVDGYHSAPSNLPVYLGDLSFDCGLVSNSPYLVNEYENSGMTFVPTGNTQTLVIAPTQVSLSSGDPLTCVMVIPKLTAAPTNLLVQLYGVCGSSTSTVTVSCPQVLVPFFSTARSGSLGETCGYDTDKTYYSAPVNGNSVTLGLYDWVFNNQNGTNVLPDGYYTAPIHCPPTYDSFEVLNGVIRQFLSLCSPVDLDYSVEDTTSSCVSGGITSANLLVEWMPLATTIVNANANATGTVPIQVGLYKATFTVSYGSPIVGCGGIDMRLKLNSVEVASNLYITPSALGVYQLTYLFSANGLTNYSLEATVSNGTPL